MRCILFISIVFSCLSNQAQSTIAKDSLLSIVKSERSSNAVQAYKHLSMLSYKDSFALHLHYADRGIQLAYEIDDQIGAANILMNQGVIYDITGNFDQAILHYDSAQTIFLTIPEVNDWLASLYINYGTAYYFAGNKSISLDYWLKAYTYCQGDTSDENYGIILNNVANIYEELGKYEDAIKYFKESIDFKFVRKDQAGYLTSLKNLGRVYVRLGQYKQAFEYLDKAEREYLTYDPNHDISQIRIFKAEVYLKQGQIEKALAAIQPFTKDTFGRATNSQHIEGLVIWGDILMAQQEFGKAISTYELAKLSMEKSGVVIDKMKILDNLSGAYAAYGNHEKAYTTLLQSKQHLKNLTTNERLQLEQQMQVKFSTLEKEQENVQLQNENLIKDLQIKNTRAGLWLLLGFLTIVIGIAVQVYRSRKKILALNNQLESQKEIISQSLSEKELLLKEIHHRVKNNLQVVSSLLGLQSRQVKDQSAIDAITAGRARVHSMALIHQDLYKKDNLTGIELKSYFHKLSNDLLKTYDITEEIQLTADIDEIILDVDTVIPMGLILNELITNSIKYAFPNGKGSIHVLVKESKKGLLLTVKDNGIGVEKMEDMPSGDSFGYELIESFVENMDGEWSVNTSNGTEVNILLKSYKKAA